MKFLFIGDIHIRGNNPRNRTDDYKEACKAKLRECWKLAAEYDVDAILQSGDIFHSPEVSIATLLEFVGVFNECPVSILCTVGNHDVFGYNLATYPRTSLNLLQMLVPKLHVSMTYSYEYGDPIFFNPYLSSNDVSGKGYDAFPLTVDRTSIVVAHGMLLDHHLAFEAKHTNLYEVETNADIILTGHDHTGYGAIKRADGKLFCNPGALMRLSASTTEIERPIQVALIDTEAIAATLIPLKCAKPGAEVLDRSKIEENNQRQYAMEEFSALIQVKDGQKVLLNIPDIIERIGKQEKLPAAVVKKAIELLGGNSGGD